MKTTEHAKPVKTWKGHYRTGSPVRPRMIPNGSHDTIIEQWTPQTRIKLDAKYDSISRTTEGLVSVTASGVDVTRVRHEIVRLLGLPSTTEIRLTTLLYRDGIA